MRRFRSLRGLILGALWVLGSALGTAQGAPRVELVPRVPAIPSLPGARNELRLHWKGDLASGPQRGVLSLTSGLGVLSVPGGAEGPRVEVELDPGVPLAVAYRYTGPDLKGKPLREEVDLTLPEGSVRTGFDVGMALEIQKVSPVPGARVSPGLPVPLRVEVVDRFHPGATLPAWIAAQQGFLELRLEGQSLDPEPSGLRTTGTQRCSVRERSGRFELVPQAGVPAFLAPHRGRVRIQVQGALILGNARSPLAGGIQELTVEGEPPAGVLRWMAGRIPPGEGEVPSRSLAAVAQASAFWPADPRGAGKALAPILTGEGADPGGALLRNAAELLEAAPPGEETNLRLLQGVLTGARGGPWGLVRVDRGGLKALRLLDTQGAPYGGPKVVLPRETLVGLRAGQRLVLRLSGNGGAPVTLTKILPEGVRSKTYPAGTWEKAVTVYGDRLAAPAP